MMFSLLFCSFPAMVETTVILGQFYAQQAGISVQAQLLRPVTPFSFGTFRMDFRNLVKIFLTVLQLRAIILEACIEKVLTYFILKFYFVMRLMSLCFCYSGSLLRVVAASGVGEGSVLTLEKLPLFPNFALTSEGITFEVVSILMDLIYK